MPRSTPALLVLLLALCLTGCQDASTPGRAGPEPDPTPDPTPSATPSTATVEGHAGRYDGPLTAPVRHDPPGLTLDPPGGATAGITWSAALAGCFRGPIRCVATGDARVSLAVVTGPGDAAIAGRPLFDHLLAYVVTWSPSACYTRDADRCRVVNLVTARERNGVAAGSVLYAFEVTAEPTA